MMFERKVHPLRVSSSNNDVERKESQAGVFHVFLETYRALAVTWYRCQIGHRCHYSVERMLAFRDYNEHTSPARVIAVCILYPIPAFLTMFLIECIPLRDPADGWKANWALWIRMLVSAFVVSIGILFQFKTVIEAGVISNAKTIGSAIAAALYYTGVSVGLAAAWKFPIPFGLVVMVFPYEIFVNGLFVLCIGPRIVKENSKLRKQLFAHWSVASAQLLLTIVYPIFNAIFIHLSGPQQALFVMLLPTLKFGLKQTIACTSTYLHERVAGLIVFNVDVFNVIYVAMCMQTAQSVLTTVFLMTSDAFHIALALRTIYYHTNTIQEYRERANTTWKLRNSANYLESMPSMVRAAFGEAEISQTTLPETIRLFAPFKLSVSTESVMILTEMASKRVLSTLADNSTYIQANTGCNSPTKSGPTMTMITRPIQRKGSEGKPAHGPTRPVIKPECANSVPTQPRTNVNINSIIPSEPQPVKSRTAVKPAQSTRRKSMSTKSISHSSSRSLLTNLRQASLVPLGAGPLVLNSNSTEEAVQEGLQALFHCEYVILAEYVECAIPLLYAVYLAGLFHLPNAAYYPHTRNLSHEKMLSTLIQLIVYGLLEFASFIGLHFMLKRRFGYSPIYQLAFVLETEVMTLQSLLFAWVVFALPLTLVHYGVNVNSLLS